ncbi:MAG: hypothetical protein ACP5I6_02735 [Caldisphaera sp.]|jgi:hypothetical protein|nr:hypothetical protein [Caldisphaera sp.]
MYCQQQDCEAVGQIINLIKPEKGGSPAFNAYHVIETLKILKNKHVGRPYLSQYFNLGEASIKTLFKRLKYQGLITQIGRYNILTDKGNFVLNQIESKLNLFESKLKIENLENCLILILHMDPPKDLTSIHGIRDEIIANNCKLVVVGFIDNNLIGFPGLPDELQDELINCSKQYTANVNRGVIIITPKYCLQSIYSFFIFMVNDCCAKNHR